MTCINCGSTMDTRRGNVPYSALLGTTLVGVEVRGACRPCRGKDPRGGIVQARQKKWLEQIAKQLKKEMNSHALLPIPGLAAGVRHGQNVDRRSWLVDGEHDHVGVARHERATIAKIHQPPREGNGRSPMRPATSNTASLSASPVPVPRFASYQSRPRSRSCSAPTSNRARQATLNRRWTEHGIARGPRRAESA